MGAFEGVGVELRVALRLTDGPGDDGKEELALLEFVDDLTRAEVNGPSAWLPLGSGIALACTPCAV